MTTEERLAADGDGERSRPTERPPTAAVPPATVVGTRHLVAPPWVPPNRAESGADGATCRNPTAREPTDDDRSSSTDHRRRP